MPQGFIGEIFDKMSSLNTNSEKFLIIQKSVGFDLDNSIPNIKQLLEYRKEVALRLLSVNSNNNFDDLMELFNLVNEQLKQLLAIE